MSKKGIVAGSENDPISRLFVLPISLKSKLKLVFPSLPRRKMNVQDYHVRRVRKYGMLSYKAFCFKYVATTSK